MPLMLCKLLGGSMAAIGLPGAIFIISRRANPSLPDIVSYVIAGVAGIAIFAASSRALSKRSGGEGNQNLPIKDKQRMSTICWIILLMLAAAFLLITNFMTKR